MALGSLMRAIGLHKVTDTDELIGAQIVIKLDIKAASDGYDASNEVRGYKSVATHPANTAPVIQGTNAKAAPPWAK